VAREAIVDGLSPEEATARLVKSFGDHLGRDEDTEKLFWMALAAAQFETALEADTAAPSVVVSGRMQHGGSHFHDRRDLRARRCPYQIDYLEWHRVRFDGDLVAELDR
jgi:hypothetical protein